MKSTTDVRSRGGSAIGLLGGMLGGALVVLGTACSGNSPGCTNNSNCPAGHVCSTSICMQLCNTSDLNACAPGNYCDGEFCKEGDLGMPRIEAVSGNSQADCDIGGTLLPCIGTRIVVIGDNVAGGTYTMASQSGLNFTLTEVASTGKSVDLIPDVVLTPADGDKQYTLTVTNAAGSALVEVKILQGDKGDKGNPGDKGDPGDPGGGGTMYFVKLTTTSGVPVPTNIPLQEDRIVVSVEKASGVVSFVAIDSMQLQDACADEDGCTIELGLTGYIDANETIEAPYMGPPCRFYLRDAGGGRFNWAVSPHCYQTYQVTDGPGSTTIVNYTPYVSDGAGTDGLGATAVPGTTTEFMVDNRVVLDMLNACFFAETTPPIAGPTSNTIYELAPDNAVGFFLFTGDNSWWDASLPDSAWDPNVTRTCQLVIQD